jgi:hypothetical protein
MISDYFSKALGWHNRPIGGRSAEWTQLDSTGPPNIQFKKTVVPFEIRDMKYCNKDASLMQYNGTLQL